MSKPAQDEIVAPAPVRKPRKKRRFLKRGHRAAAPPVLKMPDEFAGMTTIDCPAACNAERCVISGINVCFHPMKNGLPSSHASNGEVVARYERAKKALAHQKIDLRGA